MLRTILPAVPSPHALGLAQLVAWGATFYALPPLLPRMMADMEVSATSLSVAMGAGLGISAFGSIAVGAWIQRHGARAPMVGGTLLATLALSGMALSASAGGVLVSLGVLGMTNAALLYEPAFAAVGTHTRDPVARIHAIQLISFWGGWAALWAVPAATLLSDAWGWRAALLSLASLLLLQTLPIHWRLPPAHATPPRTPAYTTATRLPFRLLAGFAVGACATGAIVVHGILLLLERRVDPDTAALVFALMAPVQVAARTWLLRRRGRLASYDHVLPLALIASGLGALLAAPRAPALILFVVLFGAGNGLLTPVRAALVAMLVPAEQLALQLGVMNLVVSLARAAAPLLGAATYALFGFHGAVLSTTTLAIASALLVNGRELRRRRGLVGPMAAHRPEVPFVVGRLRPGPCSRATPRQSRYPPRMILSDRDIRARLAAGDLKIEPLLDERLQIQPASVDLRLAAEFIVYRPGEISCLDPKAPESLNAAAERIVVRNGDAFTLHPGDFALGSTLETVSIPTNLVGQVDGRSSIGRLAIVVHATAGLIDPGFTGQVTLELSNIGRIPVRLYPGMRIAQIVLQQMTSSAQRPYGEERGSSYNEQSGPQVSRLRLDGDRG